MMDTCRYVLGCVMYRESLGFRLYLLISKKSDAKRNSTKLLTQD